MLGILEGVNQTDIDKLKIHAQRVNKPLEDVFHEFVEDLEQRKALMEDEQDPNEKAFNDAARSPEVRQAFEKMNNLVDSPKFKQILKDKGVT